jgi:peptidoglycan hydrolase CwlO-like protein
MEQMDQAALATLHGKIDRLNDGIDAVKEKQEEMSEHVSKIKEAVYNPDSGLYARLRSLEQWRDITSRTTWYLATAVGGLILKTVWDLLLA